mgnify:CR=1 FL=1
MFNFNEILDLELNLIHIENHTFQTNFLYIIKLFFINLE